MSGWTPGPWAADFSDAVLIKSGRNTVASIRVVDLYRRAPMPEVTANARLVSAAPDMYAALEALRLCEENAHLLESNDKGVMNTWLQMGQSARAARDAALAKARGQ